MDDNNEYDIYDDLDVFDSDEKQQEQSPEYVKVRQQLSEAQEEIRRLKEENDQLKVQIVNHQKAEGTLERNSSSLLITAKAELKRREHEIHELRKEKDNIVFRRRDKLQKNVQTHNAGTQSQITCKPFVMYELKRVDDIPTDKLPERNYRRDENPTFNPFAKSKENNNDNKVNHKTRDCFVEKNGNHRHQPSTQSRQQDDHNLRGKHVNQRSRDDERRDQSNAERLKRRRSRSASKDRKRVRRSRRCEQQQQQERRRDRNNHDRKSPEKTSSNLRGKNDGRECQSPKRSTNKSEKHHNKHKNDENISKRHSSKDKSESDKRLKDKEKEMEKIEQSAVPNDSSKNDVKQENVCNEKPTPVNWSDLNGEDALEEGEIDEHNDEHKIDVEIKKENVCQSGDEIFHTSHDAIPKADDIKPKKDSSKLEVEVEDAKPNIEDTKRKAKYIKLKMETNYSKKMLKTDKFHEKGDEIDRKVLSSKVDHQKVELKQKPEIGHDVVELQTEPAIVELQTDLDVVKLETEPEVKVKSEPKCPKNQFFDGDDNAQSNQKITVKDEISNNGGKETTSNVQTETNLLPKEVVHMDVDVPVEVMKVDTKSENDVPNIQDVKTEDLKQENETVTNLIKSDESSPTTINDTPSQNTSMDLTNEHDESNKTSTANSLLEGVLNTSGNKSVKNISTSSKDYLIVENENNETTIYVTRKKKKKKKKKSLEIV